jgi:hypothetical protein
MEVGLVMHICNPALRRLRQKDGKLKASLLYIVRPCPPTKKKKKKNKQNAEINPTVT